MKVNANQMRQALDSANPATRLYLLHGPDESGARDLALRLGRAMGPDVERIDLDGATLKSDPGRLATEAASLSLFGGARYIRLTGLGEDSHDALALLLSAEQAGNPVVAIAPGLKTSGKVVKLVIGASNALSFACYPLDAADADRLAVAIASEHGLRTTGGTASRLFAAAGGDRAILTREIEKLALYLDASPERPAMLDDDAIDAVGADVGDAEIGRAIEAAIAGDLPTLGGELARLEEAGVSLIPVLRGLVRRLMLLAELQADVAAGASIGSVIEGPRVFFKDKPGTGRALRQWNAVKLSGAIDYIRQAERATMSTATAGPILAEAACITVARAVQRQR